MNRSLPALTAGACLALAAILAHAAWHAGLWGEVRHLVAGIAVAGPVIAGLLRMAR